MKIAKLLGTYDVKGNAMNLDAEDFLYDLVFESSPEEPNDDAPERQEPSDELYDPWETDDPAERRRDPLR